MPNTTKLQWQLMALLDTYGHLLLTYRRIHYNLRQQYRLYTFIGIVLF